MSLQITQWILTFILILSSVLVITARKPVYASLSFLLTLVTLAAYYLLLSAEFIAVMQVIVYAGAIMVIFMFVIVLFQDAHYQLAKNKPESSPYLLLTGVGVIITSLFYMWSHVMHMNPSPKQVPVDFGTVESLGFLLYLDYFFPFEAVILLFLIAIIGAFYIGKKAVE